jgi:hypothetical protein
MAPYMEKAALPATQDHALCELVAAIPFEDKHK